MAKRRAYLVMPFFIALSGCLTLCQDTWQPAVASSDGKYYASVFIRACGATTSEYAHVVLRSQGLLSSYRDDNIVFSLKYDPEVKLEWIDSTHLVIRYQNNPTISDLSPPKTWQTVQITAVPISP